MTVLNLQVPKLSPRGYSPAWDTVGSRVGRAGWLGWRQEPRKGGRRSPGTGMKQSVAPTSEAPLAALGCPGAQEAEGSPVGHADTSVDISEYSSSRWRFGAGALGSHHPLEGVRVGFVVDERLACGTHRNVSTQKQLEKRKKFICEQ